MVLNEVGRRRFELSLKGCVLNDVCDAMLLIMLMAE